MHRSEALATDVFKWIRTVSNGGKSLVEQTGDTESKCRPAGPGGKKGTGLVFYFVRRVAMAEAFSPIALKAAIRSAASSAWK
ncbi:hypothetical protein D9M68_323270 [compost metagenome]